MKPALRFHTANPRVFGSIVHGNDEHGSDLGLPVDVRPPGKLPIMFRAHVLAEARPV